MLRLVSWMFKFVLCGSFIFLYLFYLLIFGVTWSLLLCTGFLQLWRVGAAFLLECEGFSLRQLLLLWSCGARARGHGFQQFQSPALEYGLSSCAQAQLPHGMWNLPGPGIKLVSPALAGGFLTTGPPGEFSAEILNLNSVIQIFVCYPPPSMTPRPTTHLPCTFLSVENLREDTDHVGAPLY